MAGAPFWRRVLDGVLSIGSYPGEPETQAGDDDRVYHRGREDHEPPDRRLEADRDQRTEREGQSEHHHEAGLEEPAVHRGLEKLDPEDQNEDPVDDPGEAVRPAPQGEDARSIARRASTSPSQAGDTGACREDVVR